VQRHRCHLLQLLLVPQHWQGPEGTPALPPAPVAAAGSAA
jgi:hypothetical protein